MNILFSRFQRRAQGCIESGLSGYAGMLTVVGCVRPGGKIRGRFVL